MIKMIMAWSQRAPSRDEQRLGESRSNDLRQSTRSKPWEWQSRDEGGASDRSRENLSSRSNYDRRQKTSKPIGDIATCKTSASARASASESKLKASISSSNDDDYN